MYHDNLEITNIEGEEWRDVPMYDGLLYASNYGRIKREGYYDKRGRWRKPKIIKQLLKKATSEFLAITFDRKTFTVLQLVGMAFYGYLKEGFCFQRKDMNPFNCRADNILILTLEESRQRLYDIGKNPHQEHAKASLKKSKYVFTRVSDGKEFLTSELKDEYPKQAFRNIKRAVKENKQAYGEFWKQRNRNI